MPKKGLHLQVLGLTQKANAGFKRTMLVAIRDAFEEGPENWVAANGYYSASGCRSARCERAASEGEPEPQAGTT